MRSRRRTGRMTGSRRSALDAPMLLLDARPSANLDVAVAAHALRQALGFLDGQRAMLERLATDRANALPADHRRVREAARDVGQ